MPTVVSIQYLRGFAALLVVVYHIGHLVPQSGVRFPLGAIGVDIFFVISGFIIWVTGKDLAPGEFLKRRLTRIVPLYWVVTLLLALALLEGGSLSVSKLFHSLFFLAPETSGTWPKPILSVGWTLNLEIFFYAIFALALFLPRKMRFWAIAMALGGVTLWGAFLSEEVDTRLLFYTSSFMAEFLIGMGLGALWLANRIPAYSRNSLLALVAATMVYSFLIPEGANRLIAYGGFTTVLFLLALGAEQTLRQAPNRLLHLLGDSSYALYLTHLPVIKLCRDLGQAGVLPSDGLVLAVIILCATLIVGVAVHFGVERPMHRALTAKRQAREPSVTNAV